MPRGRRRKFKLKFKVNPDTVRSVIALFFLLLSCLSLISFFASEYWLNYKILMQLKSLFGKASFVVPLLLASISIVFIDKLKTRFKEGRIVFSLFTLLLSLSGILHVFRKEDRLEAAREGLGGGYVGYHLSSFLISALSKAGAFIALIVTLVISLLLLFNISFDKVIEFLSENKILGKIIKRIKSLLPSREKSGDVDVNVSTVGGFDEEDSKPDESPVEDDMDSVIEIIPSMSEPQIASSSEMVHSTQNALPLGIKKLPSDKLWEYPPLDILSEPVPRFKDEAEVEKNKKIIKATLKSFGVEVDITDHEVGSSVTQYVVRPKSVTKVSRIASLQDNLALALASPTGSVRIEAPIPGKAAIGIEVPNRNRSLVYFKNLITSDTMKNLKSKLGIVLGESVSGKILAYDIGKMPHLLIAGTTGSGKSIFIHNLLFSILYRTTPQEVKLVIVDPKRVELINYQGIPHLLTPVVTDMDKAPSVFRWAVDEMDRRYKLFEQAKVRNIDAYNEKSGIQVMPYILIVIDELSDIMTRDPASVERNIIRIAQLARATGIHLVMAVQRPSTDIITGLIKANIPCRTSFQVLSQVDSRVIIDQPGAEKLLGKGDMLFVPPDVSKPIRLQGAFITDNEISDLVSYLKDQGVDPDYRAEVLETPANGVKSGSSNWGNDVDDLFDQAVDIVISADKASASLLQRKLSIGYARAARIIDEMEEKGIIGGATRDARGREVLIDQIPSLESGTVDEEPADFSDDTTETEEIF